jgi:hypothetical protein
MRGFIASTAYLFAVFAALLAIEALFAGWWDLPDEESLLPLLAAAGVVFVPVLVLRRRRPKLIYGDREWPDSHIVAASAVLAAEIFLFLLIWGIAVREEWSENLVWSAGGAVIMFAVFVATGYLERLIRRREARKRGIAPEDYRPGKLARRIASTLAVLAAVFVALGLVTELSYLLV